MRHLFHSKDHKQQQSLRLQKELQKEEETLWKIEQEKRKLQEELDMKMAKKLQEEMEQREQNPQRQEEQQQPELTDEEVARRLQEELNRGQSPTHDSSPSPVAAPATPAPVPPPIETRSNQELSDEQYARMLQEQFEAEERQAQGQNASPSPALPPRTVSSTPSSSSVAPPPLPSKPVAYNHSTNSLGSSASRPSWIHHASSSSTSSSIHSSDQPVTQQQQVPPPPVYHPSSSSTGSYPPPPLPASPVTHTTSIPQYHPPATSSTTGYPPYPPSPSQQQQHPQWTSYPTPHPPQQHPQPPYYPQQPSSPAQQQPQQSYHNQAPTSPAQQNPQQPYHNQAPTSPAQQHPQQSFYNQPPSSPAQQQHRPISQQEYHPVAQQQQQQPASSTATMGSTLFAPKNDPVMFIVPPVQQQAQQQEASQHPAFMPMPAPEDHQRTMYPPQQQPVQQQQPEQQHPAQQQQSVQQQQPVQQQELVQQQQQHPEQHDEEYRSIQRNQSSPPRRRRDPTPPANRSTTRASSAPVASSANKMSDTNPFADTFAAHGSEDESSSSEEEEEEESIHEHNIATTTTTKQVDKDNQQKQQQQQQHGFDPSRYFDEEDLVDLNASAHVDDDDDDGSSDDGSYVGPVSSKPAVEMAVQTDPVSDDEKDTESTKEKQVDAVKDAGVDSKGIQTTQTTSKKKQVVPEASLLDIDLEPTPVQESTPVQRHEPRARAISNVDTKAEIQRRLAEQMKKSSATRVDPTFGISMGPPPSASTKKPDNSDKTQEEEEHAKDDKVQETLEHQESMHSLTPGPSMFYHQHHRSQSASVLAPPGTGHIPQATPYMNHTAYDDMSYTPTPVVYPANVLRAGAPPAMSPEHNEAGLATMDSTYEVPSSEYGYYRVDSNGYPAKDDSDAKSVKSNMTANPKDKALPKIPKSDPNHRHITVPSVNPGQRVWIRLNPTDTGKALAQRIHVVATYKSRKILSIKTTSGRVIPLDDTPVFDDWNEIANLEDGAPWEVEWGQKDDPFSGGRELFKSIKASLLAGKD